MIRVRLVSNSFRWMEDSEGTWLCVKTSRREATKACEEAKGKTFEVTLQKERKRRSLDSNAYAWLLIGKLAAKLNVPPEEIYRQYIPDIGDIYTIVPVKEDILDHWDKVWCKGHIGRMTRDMGPCKAFSGYHNVMCYYGSSDFDTKQMSRLIDLIVEDCKLQDIETLPPETLAMMNEEWCR